MSWCGALLPLLLAAAGGGEGPPLTAAEASDWTRTSRHGEVMAFLRCLAEASPRLRLTTLGRSPAGREIPLAVLGEPLPREPIPRAGRQRPVLYFQANIHAGEVAGKEALLMLLRELALEDRHRRELERVVLLAAPIFNCDGNEAISPGNRPWQKGPVQGVGLRTNGQGLDLNRDAVKLESPELRGLLARVILPWDPDLLVDCHTTDGSSHVHPLLADTPFPVSMDPDLRRYGRDDFLPALFARVREESGLAFIPYGFFRDRSDPAAGWATYPPLPRYLVQYMGARGRLALLSEAYVFVDFPTRVKATLALLRATLHRAADQAERILALHRAADRRAARAWVMGERFGLDHVMTARPGKVRVVGRADRVVWEKEGEQRRREFLGPEQAWRLPWFGDPRPLRSRPIPRGWLLPPEARKAVALLRRHGINPRPWGREGAAAVELFRVDRVTRRRRPYQGHRLVRVEGRWERATARPAAGAWFVPAATPLCRLACWLLEPESPDGLTTWGFFDDQLAPDRYHPVLRVSPMEEE